MTATHIRKHLAELTEHANEVKDYGGHGTACSQGGFSPGGASGADYQTTSADSAGDSDSRGQTESGVPGYIWLIAALAGGARRRMERQSKKMPPSVGRRVSGVPVVVFLTQLRSPDRDEESIPFILDGRAFEGSLPRLIRVNPLTFPTGLSSVPQWRG
jgi:hypothetical protein